MKKLKFLLATPVLVAFFALFQIETVAQVKETLEVQEIEETSFLVRENFTKEDFAKLSKELKQDFDIDFSVEKIKYDNNKIKSLDYTIRNKNYKISASETSLDKHIEPFLIVINLEESKPFKVEKYSAKPTYSYTVDNDVDPNFIITEDEWKNNSWIDKISKNQKVVYLIDGKKSSKGAAYTLNPKDILSINVHRDQKTKNKFNETVDNVVIIKTKQVKDVTNRDKDLELLFSDRKAFDRIAAKYPIYVDNVLLTKKELKSFDTKTIRSMYVEEDVKEIRLTTKTNETETFTFKIADDNSQSGSDTTSNSIFINGKESTEEELTNHINKINQQKKDSLFSSNKIQIQKINDKDTHVTIKGIGSVSTQKIVYIVDGKEISNEDFRKIHPNDIERIDILKDKKALENYGDKAKDGVLLITTKSKKEVSLQQHKDALKARELAMKKRNEVAERKEILLQNRKEREKSRQELLKKRNEISEKTQQRRKELEEERKKLLAKRKETIVVSNKQSDKKLLDDDYKILTDIFQDVNKTVKEIEDENFKITSVRASITRADGTKVELAEVY